MQGICLPEEPASKKKEKAGEFLKKAKAAAKAKAKAAAETASKATAAEEAKKVEEVSEISVESQAEVPLSATKLRVLVSVQHNGYAFRLGQRGEVPIEKHQFVCEEQWLLGGEAKELIQVKLDSKSGGGVCEIPASLLVNEHGLKDAQPLYSYKHKSRKFKQDVLMRGGVLDPQAFGRIEILSEKVMMPNEDHISIAWSHLSWAIEGKDPREASKVAFVPSQLLRTFLEMLPHKDAPDHQICFERGKLLAQRLLKQKDLILVPVWSGGKAVNHYTLLVLSRSEEGWEVRYYETLSQAKAAAVENAKAILKDFFELPLELPERCNKTRQLLVST